MRTSSSSMPTTKVVNRILLALVVVVTSIHLLNALSLLPSHWLMFHLIFQDFWVRSFVSLAIYVIWAYFLAPKYITQPSHLQIASSILLSIILIDSFGNLFGWYAINESYGLAWYDTLAHLITPAIFTIFLAINISALKNISIAQTAKSSLVLGLLFVFLFEIYEQLSDTFRNTHMIHNQTDTITDIVTGCIGCFVAYLIISSPKLTHKFKA